MWTHAVGRACVTQCKPPCAAMQCCSWWALTQLQAVTVRPPLQHVQPCVCLELHSAPGCRRLALTTLGSSRADATCLRTLSATCSWLAFMRSRSCFTACFPRICFSCRCQGMEVRHGKVKCHSARSFGVEWVGFLWHVDKLWGRRLLLQPQACLKRDGGKLLQPDHSLAALDSVEPASSRAAGKDRTRPGGHAATCCQPTGRQVQRRAAAAGAVPA